MSRCDFEGKAVSYTVERFRTWHEQSTVIASTDTEIDIRIADDKLPLLAKSEDSNRSRKMYFGIRG